jgi:hypothetical protein
MSVAREKMQSLNVRETDEGNIYGKKGHILRRKKLFFTMTCSLLVEETKNLVVKRAEGFEVKRSRTKLNSTFFSRKILNF